MAKFTRYYLETELKKLDDHLKNPVDLYLIGGGAMSFQKLKDATKDVDIVVLSTDELNELENALLALGYKKPYLSNDYKKLGANIILENENGFRWDIFVKIICNGLQISTGMRNRAIKILGLNKISVYSIALEDIFIFKSITTREHDLLDMYTLFSSGLDFDVIKEEIIWQNDNRSTEFAWLAYFYDGFEKFLETYNLSHPLLKSLKDIAYENMLEQMIVDILKKKLSTLEDLSRELNIDENEIKNQVQKLLSKKTVEKVNDSYYKYYKSQCG